jgi:hypothetical protein
VAAVAAALYFAAAEPALAALLGLEAAVAVPAVARGRVELTGRVGELLGPAREGMSVGVGDHLAAAALALLGDRLSEKQATNSGMLEAELTALLA